MPPDVPSLSLGMGGVALAAAASLWLLADRRYGGDGYGAWAAGLAVQGIALAVFGLRSALPQDVSDFVTNGAYLASLGFLVTAAARLRGASGNPWIVASLLAVPFAATVWFTFADPLPPMRVLLVGAGALFGFALLTIETGRLAREETRPATRLLHGVTLAVAVAVVGRSVEAITNASWSSSTSTPGNLALYAGAALFYVGSSLALLGLFTARARDALDATRDALARQARTDALTGLANRRAFAHRLEVETLRSRRYGRPLSLLIADIDRFKQVNDRHGHPVGDAVLVHLAEVLRATTRSSDHVARVGGEEFALLLPETGRAEARDLGERIRSRIAAAPAEVDDGTVIPFTLSVGAGTFDPSEDADTLYRRVDRALYLAKHGGRDRLVHADDEPQSGPPG